MVRELNLQDTKAITDIYNDYVVNSIATFETVPVEVGEMRKRLAQISSSFPCFVYETDGQVVGYCYAHAWKEKAAYRFTLETTIYLSSGYKGKGVGKQLMRRLIEACRERGYHVLIACITEGNDASFALHSKLGFKQVSDFKKVGLKFDRWLGVTDYELLLDSEV